MAGNVTLPDGFVLDSAPPALPEGFVIDQPADQQSGIGQTLGNIAAGAVRGAGSIGATILAPIDAAARAVGIENDYIGRSDRRQAMDAGLEALGAQPDSLAYKGGKIAAEIAGTAGAGGALGNAAARVGLNPAVGLALKTGGFATGGPAAATVGARATDAALRVGAGAVTGATQAAMVDPEQAGTGAIIGGAAPYAVKAAGAAGRAIKNAIGTMTTNALGATTGVGADAVRVAYEAGKNKSQAFLDNLRGDASFDDIVGSAKQALSAMRAQRSAAYKSGMVDIKADKTVLNFKPIDDALNDVVGTGTFKGVSIRKKAAETIDDLKTVIDEWRALDPAEYHTPEGLDALKQAVWDVAESAKPGSNADRAVKQVYNAIKGTINKQAPAYAKVMRDYSQAAETLKELEKSLSLGNKAARDTSIRKLQSIMRNNVNTSYGNRADLVKKLEEQGGADLLPAIAGQSMNTWMPRGMVGAVEKAGVIPAAYFAPGALAAAPLTSPRLVGEAAYGLGQMLGGAGDAVNASSNALLRVPLQQRMALGAAARTAPFVILSNQTAQQ